MATNILSRATIQDIILELQVNGEFLEKIDNKLALAITPKDVKPIDKVDAVAEFEFYDRIMTILTGMDESLSSIRKFTEISRNALTAINQNTADAAAELNKVYHLFKDGKLQAIEDKKEFLDALKDLGKDKADSHTAKPEQSAKPSIQSAGTKIGELLMKLPGVAALLGLAKTIGGWIKTFAGAIAEVSVAVGGFAIGLVQGVAKILGFILKPFLEGFKGLWKILGGLEKDSFLYKFTNLFIKIESKFSAIWKTTVLYFGKLLKAITGFENISSILFRVAEVFPVLTRIFLKFKSFGKLVGTYGAVVLAAYDGIMSALDAFKKGMDWTKILEHGISGFIGTFIGGIMDLVKDLSSWIVKKLGFASVAEALDGFSFVDVTKIIADKLFTWVKNMWVGTITWGMDRWKDIMDSFDKGGIIGLMKDTAKRLYNIFAKFQATLIDWAIGVVKNIPVIGKKWAAGLEATKPIIADIKNTETKPEYFKTEYGDGSVGDIAYKMQADRVEKEKKDKLAEIVKETKTSGAEMYKTQEETNDLNDQNSSSMLFSPTPSAGSNVTANTSSVIFNQNNMPDRTDMFSRPAWNWQ